MRGLPPLVPLPGLALALVACASEIVVLERVSERDATVPRAPMDAGAEGGASAREPDAASVGGDAAQEPEPVRWAMGNAFDHTCAVVEGDAYCWGRGDDGQLGLGSTEHQTSPRRVPIDGRLVNACAGEAHSCALGADGRLWCWGKNLHGELGLGDFEPRLEPTLVPGARFVRIACGGFNSCGIAASGALSCWGNNFEGKGGQNDAFTAPDITTPQRVSGRLEYYDVAVGQGHVCAVTRDGALYCWGRNTEGQLGLGNSEPQLRAPTRVGTDSNYRAVAAGQVHTCAVHAGGALDCWGTDVEGSLGLGLDTGTVTPTPTEVRGAGRYHSVAIHWFHSCAVRIDGTLWCWGRNEEQQLGLADTQPRSVPTRVGQGSTWQQVTAGHFHSCGVADGALFCWGENSEWGQLGLGGAGRRGTPTRVPVP